MKQKEDELKTWVIEETDRSRYTSLGEISALVAHDLATPLHVLDYCTNKIKEHYEKGDFVCEGSECTKEIKQRNIDFFNRVLKSCEKYNSCEVNSHTNKNRQLYNVILNEISL